MMDDFIPTRGSQIKKTKTDYISVHYEMKKKVKSTDDSSNEKFKDKSVVKQTHAQLKEQQEKEMKKLRYEIIKFGMSGFEKPKAKKAKIELAISLGAIPSKNRKINYKTLKARKKVEKEKKEVEHKSGLVNSLRKPKSKKTRKKDSGILHNYGKVSKDVLLKKN